MRITLHKLVRVGASALFGVFFLFSAAPLVALQQLPFVTTWKTDNPGHSNPTSITVPTAGPGYLYDVDWNNDGIYDTTGVTGSISHNYGKAGIYTIRIRGAFPQIKFDGGGDAAKLLKVLSWGDIEWRSMEGAFSGCTNMLLLATDAPDLSQVTSMRNMFRGCEQLNAHLNDWNTSHVTNMSGMFAGASTFNQPLDNWDVSHVTDFSEMFLDAHNFDQKLKSWDTGSVTDMRQMFAFATNFNQELQQWNTASVTTMRGLFRSARQFNREIGTWNTASVTDMSRMFEDASEFNRDIGSWDVSSVVTMARMFYSSKAFDRHIGSWNTARVTTMTDMFRYTLAFNKDIGSWDMSSVTDIAGMFYSAKAFNQDVSGWDVSNVTKMNGTFAWTTEFNHDLSGWDVSSVTDMTEMFWGSKFDQDLQSWDVSQVTNMSDLFAKGQLSQENYDELLQQWVQLDLQPNVRLDVGQTTFCAGAEARTALMLEHGWTIFDGGSANLPPTPVCRDITVFLDANGSVTIRPDTLDGGSFDHCGETELQFSASRTVFDCSDIGQVEVVLTVKDRDGNAESCTATVTVEDAPAAIYKLPKNVTVAADVDGCKARVFWTPPTTNCRSTLTATHRSGDLFPVGTTVVSYMATEGAGEPIVASFVVTVTTNLQVGKLETAAVSCRSASDGHAEVTVSGGRLPYHYDWQASGAGGYGDERIANGLPVGPISLTVRDAIGCEVKATDTIDSSPLTVRNLPTDIVATTNTDDCRAVVSWIPPTFSCDAGTVTSNYVSGDTFPVGSTSVVYTYTDERGERLSSGFLVTVRSDLRLVVEEIVMPSCFAGQDGEVLVTASGGRAPFSYDWDADGTGDFDDAAIASGLAAAQYDVRVKDSTGCVASGTVRLSEPEALVVSAVPVTTEGGERTIDLSITGGTAPFQPLWSGIGIAGHDDAEDIRVTANGTFEVVVTDGGGCTAATQVTVSDLPEICKKMDFDVFPNPTTGEFAVKFEQCAYPVPITVYDSFGRHIAVTTSEDLSTDLDFSNLAKGLYYLRVDGRYEVTTRTVLVR
ncbi:putative secreted protein (Por secretion system target) [Neolewinella xylanilytica]|uniref:Putative secreted protein (Por secretion system target) n=1 Tax=Neolewinella xylanilytica TaxID=1514080 RepID=A0A2S6IAS6_9BACT|nr:BspA family leucine-rich repeat surface protein [Neolewinella xylanilytica]PPK88585.1 putative secreted protein (Por secretion system target) [Neolewinella xylanilytica]